MLPLLALLLLQVPVRQADAGQIAEQPIASDVARVTVFLRGAQVTREARNVRIPAGTTDLVFTGLTPALDPQSLQFDGDIAGGGDFVILSVAHRINYLEPDAPTPEILTLQGQLEVLQDSLALERALLDVYRQEEALLLETKNLGGDDGVQVEELRQAAAFYREQLTEIKRLILQTDRRIQALEEAIVRVQGQLGQLRQGRDRRTSEVVATVQAATPMQATLRLSYLTRAAGWTPRYDLRVEEVGAPLVLAYHADVQQTSGEVWDDVRLTLSTADPSRRSTAPELSPWFLGFYEPRPVPSYSLDAEEVVVPAQRVREADMRQEGELANLPSPPAPPPVVQAEGATSVTFEITIPYTIPPDGRPRTVQIQQADVPAEYRYFAAPKLEEAAYLTARVPEWEDYDLLSGPANLFLEGTYVGQSFLDVASTADTLVVSLGQDPGVVVERTKQRDFSDRQRLGTRREETLAFEIEVRNTKRRPIEIVVEDQVPRATNDQIDVDEVEADGADFNEETGLLRWRLTVAPQQTETVAFRYEVTYPSGRRVILE